MKYVSLFSGIECASLAAKPLGWTPVAFSEIDPFACAVLAHHYPEVPNVGDVTAVDWTAYRGAAELVIGGSPCQAFSVAGRRESLGDARGNLTLTFVEAVNAIDPTFVVWENVPGVLSTRDNAFGCFLAALAGHDRPLHTPDERGWPAAGVVVGPRRHLAWRVLDAQYFGVPQRRRRVFLVGCSASSGIDPAEILFEREGVCRDSAPRREAGEDIAGTFKSRTRSGGWSHDVDLAAAGYMQVAPTVTGGPPYSRTGNDRVECEARVVGAVSSKWAKGTGGPAGDECQNLVAALTTRGYADNDGQESRLVVGALGANLGTAGPSVDDMTRGMYIPVNAHTLQGRGFDASEDGTGRGTPLVVTPIDMRQATRGVMEHNCHQPGCGLNARPGDPAYTLTKGQVQAVAFHGSQAPDTSGDVTHPVGRNQGQETCIAFTQNQCGDVLTGDVCGALGTNQNATGRNTAKVPSTGVRRLTPKECERLQGLPDDYTLIPYRDKPAADGPRYKALGNGMAVPCVRWILERIQREAERTLESPAI